MCVHDTRGVLHTSNTIALHLFTWAILYHGGNNGRHQETPPQWVGMNQVAVIGSDEADPRIGSIISRSNGQL